MEWLIWCICIVGIEIQIIILLSMLNKIIKEEEQVNLFKFTK